MRGHTMRILPLVPSMAGILLFFVVPLFDVLRRSFLNDGGTTFVGAANYQAAIANGVFREATAHTLLFLAVGLPLLLGLSLLAALLLEKATPLRSLAKSALLVPLAVPSFAVVLVVALLFDPVELADDAARTVGMSSSSRLDGPAAFVVLEGLYIWKNLGFAVLLWLTALSRVPLSCREAAVLDGAGRVRSTVFVVLPLIAPMATFITVLSVASAFRMYREAYLLFGAYPPADIYLIPHLFANWFADVSIGKLAAATVLLIVPFVLIASATTVLARRNGRRR